MTFQGAGGGFFLAGLSHGQPEDVPLPWGTKLVVLQLPAAKPGFGLFKGLTLKLLNKKKKKKSTQIYEAEVV